MPPLPFHRENPLPSGYINHCHCERSDAISRQGELPQSSCPVPLIRGLPRSNFVRPRRDRKKLSLRASKTSDATSVMIHCHCETRLRVVATLGRSPPLRHAARATSPVSSGEPTPGRVYYRGAVAKTVNNNQKKRSPEYEQ